MNRSTSQAFALAWFIVSTVCLFIAMSETPHAFRFLVWLTWALVMALSNIAMTIARTGPVK